MRYGILMVMTSYDCMAFSYTVALMGEYILIFNRFCKCRYSRKLMWLKVASTNHNPHVIVDYYLNAVAEFKGL